MCMCPWKNDLNLHIHWMLWGLLRLRIHSDIYNICGQITDESLCWVHMSESLVLNVYVHWEVIHLVFHYLFQRETTSVTSCWLSNKLNPFKKGFYSKNREYALQESRPLLTMNAQAFMTELSSMQVYSLPLMV